MKTLTKDGISLYLFDDAEALLVEANQIKVGDPIRLIISDCNSTNTLLFEGVTPPEDWFGCKYLFDGNNWELNPDWVDPKETLQ